MAKVTLETWMERVSGVDEMGRVLTFRGERIGHYFEGQEFMTIKAEYVELFPQAIGAIAQVLGTLHATRALHNMRIVP